MDRVDRMDPDSVDEMVLAWSRRDPDLDTSALEVVGRLLLCATHLRATLVDTLEPLGLSFGDFDVINTLRRRDDPAGTNARDLARSSLITSGAMTARLDRLQHAALIRRAPDPHDRRGLRIHLTPSGERLADQALGVVLAADTAFLEPIDRDEQATIAATLKRLLQHTERD